MCTLCRLRNWTKPRITRIHTESQIQYTNIILYIILHIFILAYTHMYREGPKHAKDLDWALSALTRGTKRLTRIEEDAEKWQRGEAYINAYRPYYYTLMLTYGSLLLIPVLILFGPVLPSGEYRCNDSRRLSCIIHGHLNFSLEGPSKKYVRLTDGDLGGLGGRPPKFEVWDGPCIRPPQYFEK